MKEQKIYMRAWTEIHGRAKVMATDEWYLNLANELLPLVANSYMYQGREMVEDQPTSLQISMSICFPPSFKTLLMMTLPSASTEISVLWAPMLTIMLPFVLRMGMSMAMASAMGFSTMRTLLFCSQLPLAMEL